MQIKLNRITALYDTAVELQANNKSAITKKQNIKNNARINSSILDIMHFLVYN